MLDTAIATSRRLVVLLAAAALAGAALPAGAAEHQVRVMSDFFSPATLEIEVGDRVTWTNESGQHNVRADDLSFRSGEPAFPPWSFSHTFDTAGDVRYHCQVHGSIGGLGMSGVVRVLSTGGNDEPGTLRFSAPTYSVSEGGTATITVTRVGGDDGAVTVDFATSNGSAVAGADYTARSGTLSWADDDDDPKTFTVPSLEDAAVESDETVNLALSSPTGGAGLGSPSTATLTIRDDDSAPPGGPPGSLAFGAAETAAEESGGPASVTVTRTGGTSGGVSARVRTSDGSAVAGADYTPVDATVAFGDGDGAAKSVAVPILDDAAIEEDETINLALSEPAGGASLGAPSAATLTVLDDDLPPGPCVPDESTLCLHDGRFRVQVAFRPPGEAERLATKIDFTVRAGLFWFFNPANVEMLLKVQNACVDPFQRWWVFFAATTNVEFTVTVADTQGGVVRRYSNPQGKAALPVQDTSAFATCP